MKKLVLFFLVSSSIGFAQQDAQYTQYMYNTIAVNPAYAGSKGAMTIFGLYRAQWVGIEGAPKTSTFSINTPLNNSNLGLGVSLVNDKIGPVNENALSADLSYSVPTSETFTLSFGIKATANFFNLDINKLNPEHQGDSQFQNFNNRFTPNIGAGLYWHSDKAYLGFSIPNFIETNRYNDKNTAILKDKINYYFMAGYVFDLDYYVKFKPALLTKMVQGAPVQVDVSGNFMFNDKFVVGLAYRLNASFSTMAGFQVTDGLYVGYGYDFDTTSLSRYNSVSHEIFLSFDFLRKCKKCPPPRFF